MKIPVNFDGNWYLIFSTTQPRLMEIVDTTPDQVKKLVGMGDGTYRLEQSADLVGVRLVIEKMICLGHNLIAACGSNKGYECSQLTRETILSLPIHMTGPFDLQSIWP